MAFTHVFTTTIEPLSFFDGGGWSSPIDTRGCDLFVFVVSATSNSGPICEDNQGNLYFQNLHKAVISPIKNEICYSVGPNIDPGTAPLNTSANHVFRLRGGTYAQSCIIMGFSGVDASDPLDIDGVGQAKDTSTTPLDDGIECDTVMPSLDGNLIIIGCTFRDASQSVTADAPFTGNVRIYSSSPPTITSSVNHWGNASSYYVQNPAAMITPRWGSTLAPGPLAASVAVFNVGSFTPPDGGGGGGAGDLAGWMDMPKFISPP